MKTLTNQTIYQCEFCQKRFITKQGTKKHEENYCYLSPIPKRKEKEKIIKCNHEWDTQYSPMAGESHLLEPDFDYCINCGVGRYEWDRKMFR